MMSRKTCLWVASAAVGLMIAAGAAPAMAQANSGTWRDMNTVAPLTNAFPPISRHGAVSAGSLIFAYGGIRFLTGNGTWNQNLYQWDPLTNNLSNPPLNQAMPFRDHFAYASVNVGGVNWLLAIGGLSQGLFPATPPLTLRWRVGISSAWETTTALGVNRTRMGAAINGTDVHIVGGIDGTNATVSNYDIFAAGAATPTVTAQTNLPRACYQPYVGIVQNNLYVIGGLPASIAIDRKDLSNPAWQANAFFADNTYDAGGYCTYKNRIFIVCGGIAGGAANNFVREFNPNVAPPQHFVIRPNAPISAFFCPAAVCNNRIYSIGGELVATERFLEYTPPVYGPNDPTNPQQATVNGPPIAQGGTLGAKTVFSANVTDPDPGQMVRLDVEVRAFGSPPPYFFGVATGIGELMNQSGAPVQVEHPPLTNGMYMWRYVAYDEPGDQSQSGWADFGGTTDLDFVVDEQIVFEAVDNAGGDGVFGDKGGDCSAGGAQAGTIGLMGALLAAGLVSFLRRS